VSACEAEELAMLPSDGLAYRTPPLVYRFLLSWMKEATMARSRGLVFLVVGLMLALLAPPLRSVHAQDATPEATPAPRFTNTVEVDGRRLGLTCLGRGSPTVVLIGGMISPADRVWPATVAALSPLTRVCVFDRAGLGASDPQPRSPQTAADVVADLHAALAAAGEAGPFVPVGFSVGGLFAQLFARTYPDDLAGLVLVEGRPPGWNVVDLALTSMSAAEREGLRDIVTARDPEQPASPIDALISEAQVLAAPSPPSVPTVMIVAGKAELLPVEGIATVGDLEGAARLYLAEAGQARDLGARVVVAEESGHLVPFEQPEVMIAAIADVVHAVRDPRSWATSAASTPAP
jgi:pimeloyl-ACP methyl ester carboxylesterase